MLNMTKPSFICGQFFWDMRMYYEKKGHLTGY